MNDAITRRLRVPKDSSKINYTNTDIEREKQIQLNPIHLERAIERRTRSFVAKKRKESLSMLVYFSSPCVLLKSSQVRIGMEA